MNGNVGSYDAALWVRDGVISAGSRQYRNFKHIDYGYDHLIGMATKRVRIDLSHDKVQGSVLDEIELFRRSFPVGSYRSDLSCSSSRVCGGGTIEDPYIAPYDGTQVYSTSAPSEAWFPIISGWRIFLITV